MGNQICGKLKFLMSMVGKSVKVTNFVIPVCHSEFHWGAAIELRRGLAKFLLYLETTHDTVLNLSSEPRLELNELYYILYMLFGAFELKLKLPRCP